MKPDPLKPSVALLAKLGSIVVHTDELHSPNGHRFDKAALSTALADLEVKAWVAAMTAMALAPVKRN